MATILLTWPIFVVTDLLYNQSVITTLLRRGLMFIRKHVGTSHISADVAQQSPAESLGGSLPFAGDFCWYFCTGIHTCTHTHTWICFYSTQTSHLENNPLIIVPYVNQDTDRGHTYMYMCFAEEVIRNLESTLLQWCIQKD